MVGSNAEAVPHMQIPFVSGRADTMEGVTTVKRLLVLLSSLGEDFGGVEASAVVDHGGPNVLAEVDANLADFAAAWRSTLCRASCGILSSASSSFWPSRRGSPLVRGCALTSFRALNVVDESAARVHEPEVVEQ